MKSERKQEALTVQEETALRIEWEVFAGVLDRMLFLTDGITCNVPNEYKADFKHYVSSLKDDVLHAQDNLVEILNRAGIDYTCL